MGLSLSAEQKTLLKIFRIEEQYIIPSYQRPYSWEYDHCFQLYNDLISAFELKQDYFIGNIILAKADNNKDFFEVVDGQQRLITLVLFFKVLHLFLPEMKILEQMIKREDYEGNNVMFGIRSDVFEAADGKWLTEVLSYDLAQTRERFGQVSDNTHKINERECKSRFESNMLYFFYWIEYFRESGGDLKELTSYLLKGVYLLPIELGGPTQDQANEKALVIFETINNRGMNLEDADIFKAKLYNKAKNVKEEKEFIELWTDFKANCDKLRLGIDDIFRYYSHVIRGKEGITLSETNLRQFFTTERFSPFELKKYGDVLSDLFKIIGILELLEQEKVKATELSKWLQIIDAYTNQYPKYAIVNYLFVGDLALDGSFIEFLKSLIRYVYYQGSTTTVKFEIYNIIKQTSSGYPIDTYVKKDILHSYFDNLGRLKKGFALLAFYLEEPVALPTYNIDKIINLKDKSQLAPDWETIDLTEIVDRLGNYIVLDMPKKSVPFNRKAEYLSHSRIAKVHALFANGDFSYKEFEKRDLSLKNILVEFFREP